MTETVAHAAPSSTAPSAPAPDWLAGRGPWTLKHLMAGVLLWFLVAGGAWLLRTEIVPTDPWNYVQSAIAFPSDRWVPLGFTRYGMILPLLPVVAAFGDAPATYYFWPVIGSATLGASLFLLGLRFWGRSGAVTALVLGFSSPIVLLNLTRGYPDVQSTGWAALALVAALHARDRTRGREDRAVLPLLVSGFLLGWAFETRETTVFIWPLVLLIVCRRHNVLRNAALIVAPMALWAVTDLVIGQFGYGDALMRVHAFTRQDLSTSTIPADMAVQAQYVGRSRWFYLTAIPVLLAESVGGWWTIAIGALGTLGLFSRSGGTRLASITFLTTYLGFVGVAGLFVPDHPSGRIDLMRYWVGFLPFAGLAAAGVLDRIITVLTPRARARGLTHRAVTLFVLVLALAGPVTTMVREGATNTAYVLNGADQLSRLRGYLAANEPGPVHIYSDRASLRLLPIYQRSFFGGEPLWTGRLNSLERSKVEPRPGDIVVINSPTSAACSFCHLNIEAWLAEEPIPSSWEEEYATPSRNLILYRVT